MLKVVKYMNLIREIISFKKPNCNLYMEEYLTILKNLHDKNITIMNKHLEIYRGCQNRTTFRQFLLRTDEPVIG